MGADESDRPGPIGSIRQKLVDSKQKWAAEGRLLTGRESRRQDERLPPGQHLVKNWPVLDLGVAPKLEPWDWKLTIDGLVEKPVRWSYQDFLVQPQVTDVSDIHCVT